MGTGWREAGGKENLYFAAYVPPRPYEAHDVRLAEHFFPLLSFLIPPLTDDQVLNLTQSGNTLHHGRRRRREFPNLLSYCCTRTHIIFYRLFRKECWIELDDDGRWHVRSWFATIDHQVSFIPIPLHLCTCWLDWNRWPPRVSMMASFTVTAHSSLFIPFLLSSPLLFEFSFCFIIVFSLPQSTFKLLEDCPDLKGDHHNQLCAFSFRPLNSRDEITDGNVRTIF